jgi:hypothetical protein
VLGQDSAEHDRHLLDFEMKHSLSALHPALPLLTCLTYCAFGGVPAQRFLDVLPVGLVELTLDSQLPQQHLSAAVRTLSHLTNVTKLHLPGLHGASVLPPLLCSLACGRCFVQPLLLLRHLKHLSLWHSLGMDPTIMRQLSAVSQVTHLSVTCRPVHALTFLSMSDLPPLRKLTLPTFAGVQQVDMHDRGPLTGAHLARPNNQTGLGFGKHLTCLVLQDLQLLCQLRYLDRVGPQLKEFAALEELRLVHLHATAATRRCQQQHRMWHKVGGIGVLCI